MRYLITTPWWLRMFYPKRRWSVATKEKVIFLTFDDGPHPEATPFVLDELEKYGAKATFFCIGKNVEAYPKIYGEIISKGHAVGNHTHDHLNGWQTDDSDYFENIRKAAFLIESALFRPPYGKLRSSQAKSVSGAINAKDPVIVMWSVLSGDFDTERSPEECLKGVIDSAKPGSIIVFHDSEKAFSRMKYALSETLKFFSERGYRFEVIKK